MNTSAAAGILLASLAPLGVASAQTPAPVDLEVGYRFDYDDCSPAKKKKDPPSCSHHENLAVITGGALRVDYELKYSFPGRNSGGTKTVPLRSLSWTDHTITQDAEGYTDAQLVEHPVWTLRLETNSHAADVRSDAHSDILGPSTSQGYLVSLAFPSKEAAEQAMDQIRAAKDRL